jgi:hypothetical protein
MIDQEIRNLRVAISQLSEQIGRISGGTVATAEATTATATAATAATEATEASMSPVRDSPRPRQLPPMSKSYKKTLHVSYISYIY